jgi:hypothetical protein
MTDQEIPDQEIPDPGRSANAGKKIAAMQCGLRAKPGSNHRCFPWRSVALPLQ